KRAAPARTWTLPDWSVLSRSPLKTVAPTEAFPAPRKARLAQTTVPSEGAGAAQTGVVRSENATSRARRLFEITTRSLRRVTAMLLILPATARRSIFPVTVKWALLLVPVRRATRSRVIKTPPRGLTEEY